MKDWSEYKFESVGRNQRTKDAGGGMMVGSDSGVKVTHIPTGIVAACEAGRNQMINREIAMDMIMAALTHPKFR
jgi:protein subunit release factor A